MKPIQIAAVATLSFVLSAPGYAGGGHAGGHGKPHGGPKSDAHAASGTHHGGHAHDRWLEPPARYADATLKEWNDPAATARGERLYQRYCATCHGRDGRGTGPAAAQLAHPPADLTRHFHVPGERGDAYLFWRISEGGRAEPFRSQNSAMPAFAMVLSKRERWDVLSYVHQAFHEAPVQAGEPGNRLDAAADHHDGGHG